MFVNAPRVTRVNTFGGLAQLAVHFVVDIVDVHDPTELSIRDSYDVFVKVKVFKSRLLIS